MENTNELITFLTGPGAVILTAWVASWALEEAEWWHKLKSKLRAGIILGISIAIGLAATYLSTLPPEALAPFEPYVVAVMAIVSAWLTTQGAHKVNKVLQNGSKTK